MPDPDSAFQLHPDIDVEALRGRFAAGRPVRIAPFLDDGAAERLLEHLQGREDWQLILKTKAKRAFEYDSRTVVAMPPVQRAAVERLAYPDGSGGFRYLYERISAADAGAGPLIGAFAELLGSEPAFDMLRRITGAGDAVAIEAQATRYAPGHFLTVHDDESDSKARRVAFVFGLTKAWRAEFGGLLLFHGEDGEVTAGLVPQMNALTLFAVPQNHSVSLVSPFAPEPRYSIAGWLLAGR